MTASSSEASAATDSTPPSARRRALSFLGPLRDQLDQRVERDFPEARHGRESVVLKIRLDLLVDAVPSALRLPQRDQLAYRRLDGFAGLGARSGVAEEVVPALASAPGRRGVVRQLAALGLPIEELLAKVMEEVAAASNAPRIPPVEGPTAMCFDRSAGRRRELPPVV